jgi:hypothetical protein
MVADSAIRDEATNLEKVVAFAKSIEANSIFPVADDNKKRPGAFPSKTDRPIKAKRESDGAGPSQKMAKCAPGLLVKYVKDYRDYVAREKQQTEFVWRGKVADNWFNRRLAADRCPWCGRKHQAAECKYDFVVSDK